MLVRLHDSLLDISQVSFASLIEPRYGKMEFTGLTSIVARLNTGDRVYIQFPNEADARSAFDALQSLLEAQALGNESMYEEAVVLEGTVDEVADAMSHLQELIQKNQSNEEDK